MKKTVIFIMVVTICAISSGTWAGPLASSAPVNKMYSTIVTPQERQLPDASEVGIPAYPGSQFCTITKGNWGKSAWNDIQLLSKDSYKKVSAWYRDKMKGWHCKEWAEGIKFSCSDKDPGPAGNYDPETFNVVDVLKNDMPDPCDLQGMQTGISIQYQPDR